MRRLALVLALLVSLPPFVRGQSASLSADPESRRQALLESIVRWKVLIPEAKDDELRLSFLPGLEHIERGARRKDGDIAGLEKEFVLWKNLFLSELQAAGAQKSVDVFLETERERMRALLAVRRFETKAGQEGLGRAAYLKARINGSQDAASLRLLYDNMKASEDLADAVASSAGSGRALRVRGGPRPSIRPEQASAPPPPEAGGVWEYFDWERAKELASEAVSNAKRFVGRCYAYVKKALDDVLPSGWRSSVGQGSAYQFAKSLNSNPKLFDKLKLKRVPVDQLPEGGLPPVGSIIVYGRGQCGFSPEHGHIEVVVSNDPPQACSDGCMSIPKSRLSCILQNGKKGMVNVYIPTR